ncbi:MAG: hypothetical protein AAF074_23445 [Pseudomonadota bacterium]
MTDTDERSFQMVRDSLNEAQMTVRAYDTRAQIVGVGYIFALGIVVQINDLLPDRVAHPLALVILSWAVVIFPIFHFGHVLYPTRKTAPEVGEELEARLERVHYVEPERYPSAAALRASVLRCDPLDEYCFELLKISRLRELKRKRFLRGLISAAIAFVVLFVSHIGRGIYLG